MACGGGVAADEKDPMLAGCELTGAEKLPNDGCCCCGCDCCGCEKEPMFCGGAP